MTVQGIRDTSKARISSSNGGLLRAAAIVPLPLPLNSLISRLMSSGLALDELREARPVASLHRRAQEGFQVLGDDLMEHGVLGVAGPVDRSLEGHGSQVGSRRRPGQC